MNNQPNVTRAIKNLEGELGCRLFIRSNRSVTLTPEGEKLYQHISAAFLHIENAENELIMEKNLQSGSLFIGVSEVALHCFLLPVLKKFREMYPKVRIRVSNHTTPQAIQALKQSICISYKRYGSYTGNSKVSSGGTWCADKNVYVLYGVVCQERNCLCA